MHLGSGLRGRLRFQSTGWVGKELMPNLVAMHVVTAAVTATATALPPFQFNGSKPHHLLSGGGGAFPTIGYGTAGGTTSRHVSAALELGARLIDTAQAGRPAGRPATQRRSPAGPGSAWWIWGWFGVRG